MCQKRTDAAACSWPLQGQPCLVTVDHPAFLPGCVRGVHAVYRDQMSRSSQCRSIEEILDDETYSCGTCFALDINHRNYSFAKCAHRGHHVTPFAFYLHRLMIGSWTKDEVEEMLRKTSFGTHRLHQWAKFPPDVHPHWITGCKGQLVSVENSSWLCSREGDAAVFSCSACGCYFCASCAEPPALQRFTADVNFTTCVATLLKQAIGMPNDTVKNVLLDPSRSEEERRTIVAAQIFLQRQDLAHHTFWLDIVPGLPPRVLMRHLSWVFRVRLHKLFEQPTASDKVWRDEVNRYTAFFECTGLHLPTRLNWFETKSQGTESGESRDHSSTISGAVCNTFQFRRTQTGKAVTSFFNEK